jgi:hypothetical protein
MRILKSTLLAFSLLLIVGNTYSQSRLEGRSSKSESTEVSSQEGKSRSTTQEGKSRSTTATSTTSNDGGRAVVNDAAEDAMIDESIDKVSSGQSAKKMAEARTRWVSDKVGGLNATQRDEIYGIFEQAYMDVKDYKAANPEASGDALRAEGRSILDGAKQDALAALTDEQRASLDGVRDAANTQMSDRSTEMAKKQTRQLNSIVTLTPEQVREVEALNESLYRESLQWKQENAGAASSEEKKEYARDMQKRRLEGYRDILNEEQIDKLIEYRDNN